VSLPGCVTLDKLLHLYASGMAKYLLGLQNCPSWELVRAEELAGKDRLGTGQGGGVQAGSHELPSSLLFGQTPLLCLFLRF
jgi:hypothetical protein